MGPQLANDILVILTMANFFVSIVVCSAKTGVVAYSFSAAYQTALKSKGNSEFNKYEIDKAKVYLYLKTVFLTAVGCMTLSLLLLPDLGTAGLFTLMNTAVIAWVCYYWILLKEKDKIKSNA